MSWFLPGEEAVSGTVAQCTYPSIVVQRCAKIPARPSATSGIPLKAAALKRCKPVKPVPESIPALDPKLLVTSKVGHAVALSLSLSLSLSRSLSLPSARL